MLARQPGRCGPERPIGSATVEGGHPVVVPAPPVANDLVVARLHIRSSLPQRLRAALYRPSRLAQITIDGHSYRLIVATASGPLLLRAPARELPLPTFDQQVDDHALGFSGLGKVRVDFFAISLLP